MGFSICYGIAVLRQHYLYLTTSLLVSPSLATSLQLHRLQAYASQIFIPLTTRIASNSDTP